MTHVTLVFCQVCPKWFLSVWYVWRKPCTYLASRLALSPNGLKRASTWASSPRSTIGCAKTISEPMVCFAQTVHLSCTNTNTVSKWTKTRFHMTNITKEVHRVQPKWFPSLWYIRRKLYTYLVLRLALCPNGPNRASTLASLPSSTIGCVQNDFWANGTFGANRAPILTLSRNGSKWDSKWLTSPRISIACIQNDFWAYSMLGANRAPILRWD
jgi:hypothetical protein